MARFLTNFERNKCKSRFKIDKQPLYVKDLSGVDVTDIENSVKHSFDALKNLLSNNTIEMERQSNSENHLYLKLMERAHEENNLKLINMVSSKQYQLIKTQKPKHLINS